MRVYNQVNGLKHGKKAAYGREGGSTEIWKMAADSKEYVGILSTDMTKPFDSLHPALMINKFKANGFLEEALAS